MHYRFSIVTPTFNRAYVLARVYDSLLAQTEKHLEWIVIDDGSTDGTRTLVEGWLSEKKLTIHYERQEKSGKQRACNRGFFLAQGEYLIILDSDDQLPPSALKIYWNAWNNLPGREEFAGILTTAVDPKGIVIGTPFPKDKMISTHAEIYYKWNVKGDKGECFRTDVLKSNFFPVIEGEKFLTEAVLWNRLSLRYKYLCLNQSLLIKEYQKDGYSANLDETFRNPKGYALYYNEMNQFPLSTKQKIDNNARYILWSHRAKTPKRTIKQNAFYKKHWLASLFRATLIATYQKRRILKKGGRKFLANFARLHR